VNVASALSAPIPLALSERPWSSDARRLATTDAGTRASGFCASQLLCADSRFQHLYAANDVGADAADPVARRTVNDSITRESPLMIMLTPTSVPIAHNELDGHCM